MTATNFIIIDRKSQSPSILECSPTLYFPNLLGSKALRQKNESRIVKIHVSNSLFMRKKLIKAGSLGSLIVSENLSNLLLSETKLSICDSEWAKVARKIRPKIRFFVLGQNYYA